MQLPDVVTVVESNAKTRLAKFGRAGFRHNFRFDGEWNGKRHASRQIATYAVDEDGWLVITVIVSFSALRRPPPDPVSSPAPAYSPIHP